MNATMKKFGAPESVIAEYEHWVVQLRPKQATLGAVVLICKDPAGAFSEVSPAGFAELPKTISALESALTEALGYDKINFLMLMMVDPDVHFHVLPRYADTRYFQQQAFADPGWPGPPDLGWDNPVTAERAHALKQYLAGFFSREP